MQACGLVSSGVDGSPGDSLHQQLQSKGKKRESQPCETLQSRDDKRGNDTGSHSHTCSLHRPTGP